MRIAIAIIIIVFVALTVVFSLRWMKAPKSTPENLYPYVISEAYLEHQETKPAGIVRPLGHGLHVGLVFDLDGLVQSVGAEDLKCLKMTPDQAHTRALQNLETLVKTQQVKLVVFQNGPSGKPFVLVGGHWAAATSILLPRLRTIVEGSLGTSEICVSIPHREAMLIFPKGDRAHRDAVRAMAQEKESDGQKPLTYKLFTIDDEGIKPFEEEE